MYIFFLIIALLFVLELCYFRIADRFNIIDKPNLRGSHTSVTLRGGGIIFLFATWIYAFIYGIQYPYFLIGLTVIAGISFIDDIHPMPNKVRLLIHFSSILFIFHEFGILNLELWWIKLLLLIVCVGIINAYNFMDGINGITGAYSLSVMLPLLYLNDSIQFIDSNLLIVSIISLLVFLFFNFRKQAKCFAGDVGSVAISFIVIFALGKLITTTGDFTYLIFLVIYGIDVILTIIHRILLHENLGKAHRKHLYQLLANELKFSHTLVSSIYSVLQLAISAIFVFSPINHWVFFISIILILCTLYYLVKRRYYWLHEEYLKTFKN